MKLPLFKKPKRTTRKHIGTWESNEAKTLESMENTPGIPEAQRAIFRNGFFGRLVNKVTDEGFTTYYKDEGTNIYYLEPYKIKVLTNNRLKVTTKDKYSGRKGSQIITFEGDCYFVYVTKWKFKEYFCRKE